MLTIHPPLTEIEEATLLNALSYVHQNVRRPNKDRDGSVLITFRRSDAHVRTVISLICHLADSGYSVLWVAEGLRIGLKT